jgi:muramoyltetrapeptide carboxypeptidase
MPRFPPALRPGDRIGLTAPSSGVNRLCHARLDLVIGHLRQLGFDVIEGSCLRDEHLEASADAPLRAAELMDFLTRPDLSAVLPPWGGERAIELLPLLDFERLRDAPVRWFLGYSDISTLMLPLLLRSGWACAHGPQLMDLVPAETEPLTTGALRLLQQGLATPFEQRASRHHQETFGDYVKNPDVTFSLTEPTEWQPLRGGSDAIAFEGRLIGGCLDTLKHLVGTPYGDVPGFIRDHAADGVILFLENAGLTPTGVLRALMQLKMAGWLDGLAGVMLGRSAYKGKVPMRHLSYREAVAETLGELRCPVVLDVDLGHVPPQLTLVQGALATVTFDPDQGWRVVQRR